MPSATQHSTRRDHSEGRGAFKTLVDGTPVNLHPSSAYIGYGGEYVIYSSLIQTPNSDKTWMQQASIIDPRCLVDAALTFFRVASSERLSKRRREERTEPLLRKCEGDKEWRMPAQMPGRIGGRGAGTSG